jgi:hypothetical protein
MMDGVDGINMVQDRDKWGISWQGDVLLTSQERLWLIDSVS